MASRPKTPVVTKTFIDANKPQDEITITFRYVDNLAAGIAYDVAMWAMQTYIKGDPDAVDVSDRSPMSFPAIDGRPVFLSESICTITGNLYAAQSVVDEEGNDVSAFMYDFDDWVRMSITHPDAYDQICAFNRSFQKGCEESLKNSNGESGGRLSGSPYTGKQDITPNSCGDETRSSAVSTTGSGTSASPSDGIAFLDRIESQQSPETKLQVLRATGC